MRDIKYHISIILILLGLAVLMFYGHYKIFGQLENTMYYSLMNLCFIPINIVAVTLVFEKLIERRKKIERLSKLNMLVGVYFSEVGFTLLDIFVNGDEEAKNMIEDFSDLTEVKKKIKNHHHKINFDKIDFKFLKCTLIRNQGILTSLISNENILEHELLADLLMATLHLRDEVLFRGNRPFTEADRSHLRKDSIRVYKALTIQWVNHLSYLKVNYPYLYKADIDVNPFNEAGMPMNKELNR